MTTLAISLELKGFCPVIRFPVTTTLEVIGIQAFLILAPLSFNAASKLKGTSLFSWQEFLQTSQIRKSFSFNQVFSIRKFYIEQSANAMTYGRNYFVSFILFSDNSLQRNIIRKSYIVACPPTRYIQSNDLSDTSDRLFVFSSSCIKDELS